MTRRRRAVLLSAALVLGALLPPGADARAQAARARHGMVVSQQALASRAGVDVLYAGGNAVDAAVATAFALAVVYPQAGNIGGGGFLVFRPAQGEPAAYDFREKAPAGATPTMFLRAGRYDSALHHDSAISVGVPGTVAGLHLAWKQNGKLAWRRLLEPAIAMAEEGFLLTDAQARSLREVLPAMKPHKASLRQFSRDGAPLEAGDLLRQPDLARTLERIAAEGPSGFYEGETARLIEKELKGLGGLITREDLRAYEARRRAPLRGSYRGYEVVTVPPPSAGGVGLLEMLNLLAGDDLRARGFGSAGYVHLLAEAMRRAFADRVRDLGDPEANPDMPIERLLSKDYAAALRRTIRDDRASVSSPDSFEWPAESRETTHVSVVDEERNAVSLTFTLEDNYGSKIVVAGGGFLLNNEMGDFSAGPGLTDRDGLIGTAPNLAGPGKRMLSTMTPTILARDGRPALVIGTPGGRRIVTAVLQAILNVVDFGMNVQDAVDAPRIHHQWLPDEIVHEPFGLSPDTVALLRARGHAVREEEAWSALTAIAVGPEGLLEGAADRRSPDAAALGH